MSRKSRRNRQPAIKPTYVGTSGGTFTAEQVQSMLAAQRQELTAPSSVVPTAAVAKMYGPGVPPEITASEAVQQMTPASPFSPGEPIRPYDGFSREPRSRDFVTGYNIAARPRLHERVSFDVLKGLIENYDVARLCIRHRIASLRSLDWKLIAAEGYDGDVTDAITFGKAVLKRPDRKTLFKPWLAKYLRGILAYDAGTLYRMRNRAGRVVGLKVIDGTMIAPLVDYWGDSPEPPAEAYVQFANGIPWNWLTRDDLIYQPYDPQDDSVYGTAPLEDILINANTDVRFQLYFLQRFTDGNLPAAFAGAPETWTPDQIEQFQEYWDSFMMGDQSRKHQIRWIPGGSSFAWSDEKDFTDTFSLFLMRKTCAAYSVVPSDLGFTESVNRSSGESQADVQHRVGDLPLAHHVMDILTAFLQDDLGLPLKFIFDLGEEQDDRVDQAQADKIYVEMGALGASEVREMRYGLPEPEGVPVPRFIMTSRGGPVPLASLMAVAGEIDPSTGAPVPGAQLPRMVFGGVEGVLPNPPIRVMSLAEQEFGPKAMPPAPPPQPKMTPGDVGPPGLPPGPVAKDGEAAPGAGITATTGIYGYDLIGDDEEDGSEEPAVAAKAASGYEVGPRSGMISLDLPEGLISPVPGGVSDHHVTVVYLGSDVDDAAFSGACERARQVASRMPGPLEGTISGVGAFAPSAGSDGKVPAWTAIAIPGAERVRDALADLSASEFRDWAPHVTLAYLDPGDPLPAPLEPVPVTFTHLAVHRGDEVRRFPLGPGTAAVKSTRPPQGSAPVVVDVRGPVMSEADVDLIVRRLSRELAGAVAKAGGPGPKALGPSRAGRAGS